MPCGLALAEGLNESMMDRIGGVAGRFEPLLKLFASRCIVRMSESWLAMGKKCRILALHVVRISLALWAMFKAVKSLFRLRADGKAKAKQLFGYTVMYEILEDALFTRSGP